jgi:hypothetical protein
VEKCAPMSLLDTFVEALIDNSMSYRSVHELTHDGAILGI